MKIKNLLLAIFVISNVAYANDCTHINAKVKKIMAQNQITGMSIAIVNQDKTEFCNYGYTIDILLALKDKDSYGAQATSA